MLLFARLPPRRLRSPRRLAHDAAALRGWGRRLLHLRAAATAGRGGGARDVFDAVPASNDDDRERCSALLRARAAGGDHRRCASLLREMLGRGIRPDRLALAAVVKSASTLHDGCGGGAVLGRCLHGLAVRAGYVDGAAVAKAVMDMYGRIGALADARQVFDEMTCPDAVCWNILITASSRAGCFDDVFHLFRAMLACGVAESMPTAVTVAVVFPVCAKLRVLRTGSCIHGYVVKSGLEFDTLCGNALISMYSKCGGSTAMDDALKAFSTICSKDVVSWNSIIAGYSENGLFEEALKLFGQMISEECLPNYSTLANILPFCSLVDYGRYYGKEIHGFVVRHGFETDISVSNALMAHYSKVCEMGAVESIFRSLTIGDIVTWNTVIAGYVMNGYASRALKLFQGLLFTGLAPDSVSLISLLTASAQLGNVRVGMRVHGYILRHPELIQETSLMNALVSFYSQCDRFDAAFRAFITNQNKDLISWNAILSACANSEQHIDMFVRLLQEMSHDVTQWDFVTILNVIRVSTFYGIKMVREAHGYAVRVGYTSETSVANAIMDAYAKCGYPHDAETLFRTLAGRNTITDNTMISCYLKNNYVEHAEMTFNKMAVKDETSWNLMIRLYAQNDMCDQAFSMFHQLQSEGLNPDPISITNILLVCIHLSSVQLVKQCHGYMLRASLEDIHLEGSLLDAYSKCGNITNAYNLFQVSLHKDLVIFTAMIGAYAMHGMAEKAVEVFSKMLTLDIKPDHVVMTALLSACSHAGLVDAGVKIFRSIREIYGVEPTEVNCACMVDLLARGGRLQDAYNFAVDMSPNVVNANAWGSLLGACKVHGEVKIGRLAADRLFSMEAEDIGNYVIMSNIYAADDKWDGVEHVRKLMNSKDMKKPAGCSWIEVEKTRHLFIANDVQHQDRSSIYDVLRSLYQQIREQPSTGSVCIYVLAMLKLCMYFDVELCILMVEAFYCDYPASMTLQGLSTAPSSQITAGYSPSRLGFRRFGLQLKVTAIFGWIRGDAGTRELNPSAESYTLTGSASEVNTKPREVSVAVVSSIMDIPSADWDACAVDSADPDKFNPFRTHAFLSSLEESGSAVKETGWLPLLVVAWDDNETVVGVVPLYLKSHSKGEFVFDYSWAEAYYSYGLEYYPKLQSCVPFTPDQVFEALVKALKSLTTRMKLSSLHVTFPSEGEFSTLKDSGFLQRIGMQYHWRNRNYRSFDEFLMDLKQPKRKNIRQERKKIPAQNSKMKRHRGDEIKSDHWDTFYKFYRNTTDNHWGRPYLTREFFHLLGEKIGDKAIEAAVELNLSKVEAGAQGEHKIQRGYLPVTTYSCHYFLDPGFGTAIGDFLAHETTQVKRVIKVLHDSGPYKEDILNELLLTQGDGV
uniref:Pentatricopeptide repeat-containing protein n=1 Tax=Leersia perrieri TaxID=77586 RepID=A0A0D9W3Y5_9ORYZ